MTKGNRRERASKVPYKVQGNLDEALDEFAGIRDKLKRMDDIIEQWGEPFLQQDWLRIRVALTDIEQLVFYARHGLRYRRGGTDRLGELKDGASSNTP